MKYWESTSQEIRTRSKKEIKMKRSEIYSFRLNFEEIKILDSKRSQLRSKRSLGSFAKQLALSRNLPKNDNDIEFLNLMKFLFDSLENLGGKLNEKDFYALHDTYDEIAKEYNQVLSKIVK